MHQYYQSGSPVESLNLEKIETHSKTFCYMREIRLNEWTTGTDNHVGYYPTR